MADAGIGHGHHFYLSAVAIVLQILSSIFLSLRLYSRFTRKSGKAGADDAFLVVGWLCGTALTILAILGSMKYGYDRHVFDVAPKNYSRAAFIGWICELLFILSTSINKVSVLLLYLRLINIFNNRNLLWAIRVTLGFTVAFMVIFTIIPLAKCTPFDANWKVYDPNYKASRRCINDRITYPVAAALSAASDLVAVIIPLVILTGLRKPLRQKLGLYAVFAVGFIVVGAGIARTALIVQLEQTAVDFTWIGGLVILASLFEYHLALICACAPSLRLVFKQLADGWTTTKREISEKPRNVETPESGEKLMAPSLSEIHTAGLGNEAGGPRPMSPLVAVAYEAGHPGIPIHLDLSPRSPLSFPTPVREPERLFLRHSGLSRFSMWSGLRTHGTSMLESPSMLDADTTRSNSIEDGVPELPDIFKPRRSVASNSTDPALNSGFVACRGCGQYHPHGFSHNEERNSGSGAWWKASSVRNKWKRRESQSTFFMEEDEEDNIE